MNRREIIYKIKQRLLEIDPEATIILYGSEARNEAKRNSDIDVLVLLSKEHIQLEDKNRISDALYNIELDTETLISPLIYTKKQWENRPFQTPFYINVMNEGIVL